MKTELHDIHPPSVLKSHPHLRDPSKLNARLEAGQCAGAELGLNAIRGIVWFCLAHSSSGYIGGFTSWLSFSLWFKWRQGGLILAISILVLCKIKLLCPACNDDMTHGLLCSCLPLGISACHHYTEEAKVPKKHKCVDLTCRWSI